MDITWKREAPGLWVATNADLEIFRDSALRWRVRTTTADRQVVGYVRKTITAAKREAQIWKDGQ
jgi:hypothetical protein